MLCNSLIKKLIITLVVQFYFSMHLFGQQAESDSICTACFNSANQYFYTNTDSALYFTVLMEERATEINDKKCLAVAKSSFGTIYRNSGEYKKSLAAFDSSLALFKELEDTIWVARTIYMIGSVYSSKGDYLKNIDYMLQSLKIYEQMKGGKSANSQARIRNSIGVAYQEYGDFPSALRYFKEAYEQSKALNDTSSLSAPLSNMGMIYQQMDSLSIALTYYKEAQQYISYANNKLNEAQIESSIGSVYSSLGNNQLAINSHERALKLLVNLDEPEEKAVIYNALGNVYLTIGSIKKAALYADSSYYISKRIGAKAKIKNALGLRIDVLEALEKYKEAIPLFRERELYIDSLLDNEKIKQISSLKITYETEKNELLIKKQQKELVISEQEKKLQTATAAIIGGGLIFLLIILFLLYNRQKLKASNAAIKEKLALQDLQKSEFQKDELKKDLELHQQEIASITLSMIRKNEQIDILKEQISKLDQNDSEAIELNRKVREHEIADIDWSNFNSHFSKVHPNFYENLLQKNKDITQSELRTAALLKMNLSTREIASITGVNIRSVDQTKYRLKKKIAENSEDSLVELIRSI